MRRVILFAGVGGVALLAAAGVFIGGHTQPERRGVTLVSASITLPEEAEHLPPGPHVDLVTQHCTACHSAGMITSQPPLSAEQWQAEVTKMRDVYRAPVPASDEPAILAYLSTLSPRR